ncbi:NAD(P)H-quinone oxidoreductase subunit H [Mobiluncus curtisii]|uniref:NAD(P)H-quinone oxidoreductase subunit H n=1 Tax=Mobiluncus curtisii TaxID=2051 RepID=A0A2X3BIT2_9ACTO|nr:NAD(P)H-quinone oxidoreductase subunit H [Mobiluncus curtisii]
MSTETINPEAKTQHVHAAAGASDSVAGMPEFSVHDGEWSAMSADLESAHNDRIAVNLGPVHPSTHGVLRVIVELEGETVKDCRLGTGYLHTVSKNLWNTALTIRASPTAAGWIT